MKTTIFKLANLLFIFALAGLFACEGPEGPQGPQGPEGPQGPQGVQGPAGEDGNANVITISLLADDITWTADEYLGRTANVYILTDDAVNQDIVDHGTVLAYCHTLEGMWISLPFVWTNDAGTELMCVLHSYELNTITLYAFQSSGVLDPDGITEYRFMLITDNTVTAPKGTSTEKFIKEKLTKTGVNINDYYEVIDYFGLEY